MGGHIAKKLGDGLMALFGYPLAQENDAERAARAPRSIHRALADVNRKSAVTGGPALNRRDSLYGAYKAVKSNAGWAGVDRGDDRAVRSRPAGQSLQGLEWDSSSGSYFPPPVRAAVCEGSILSFYGSLPALGLFVCGARGRAGLLWIRVARV